VRFNQRQVRFYLKFKTEIQMVFSKRVALCAVAMLTVLLFLVSCGSDRAATPNPAPTVTSIAPTSALAGSAAFTLTVNGTGFTKTSTVQWNGAARTTTFASATQLTAAITAADIATAAAANVTVSTPTPGGGTSGGKGFTIQAPNPAPTISTLAPTSAVAGGAAFNLTVNGAGFVNASTVQWNGAARTTTFVSATQLTAAITAADIAAAGNGAVTVSSPAPGGGVSAGKTFTIQAPNPVPTITSLAPNNSVAGGPTFILTVNGTNFINASTVQWNGAARTTTFVGATQLTASITAADIAVAAAANVTISNPAPGGGVSAASVFTISAPAAPVSISSLTPSNTIVGSPAFTLIVSGAGFVNGSTVRWVGSPRTTAFVNAGSLTASITAADLTTQGNFDVTVENPDHSISNASAFSVNTVIGGAFERVLTSTGTAPAGDTEHPIITPDGRYIVFNSFAANVVPGDTNGFLDDFIRDTCRGAAPTCVPSVIRVSVATDGTQGDGNSLGLGMLAVTPDGRYVAFGSAATNLVPNDTNGFNDIFLRDTCIGGPVGCTPSTIIVSVLTDGTQGNNQTANPSISADGRYVTFESYAGNFGFPGGNIIMLRDTCTGAAVGCTPTTSILSKSTGDLTSDGVGLRADITPDARYVVYDNNQGVYLVNTCIGAVGPCTQTAQQVSFDTGGSPFSGDSGSISANGRVVAFMHFAGIGVIYAYDTCIGAPVGCTPASIIVSSPTDGSAVNNTATTPFSLSADGRYVAFISFASNLVPGDTDNNSDLFVADTCIGAVGACTRSIKRASLAYNGAQPNGAVFMSRYAITGTGNIVVFYSTANNLVPNDINNAVDSFVAFTSY
jgi:Tol biopolymer transport system component